MPRGTHAPELRLLRPIRVIVVSRDDRFASVFRFLLDRKHLAVRSARRHPELLALVEQGADVVVIDATDSLSDASRTIAELEALHPGVGVVVVSERSGVSGGLLRLLPKWGPLHDLVAEIERTYLHRPRPTSAREVGAIEGAAQTTRRMVNSRFRRDTP